jgi:alpha-tubulin suppressor-like RCC1 family protein
MLDRWRSRAAAISALAWAIGAACAGPAEPERERFVPDWTCDAPGDDCRITDLVAGGFLDDDGHTLALLADGRVLGWGYSFDDEPMSRSQPRLMTELGLAESVAAGGFVSCAVREDGTVRCAGIDGAVGADAGVGDRHAVADVVGIDDAVAAAAGGMFACAVHRGGAVSCWGHNNYPPDAPLMPGCTEQPWLGLPCEIAGAADAGEIAAGFRHVCVRAAAGHVDCWGRDELGQLGDGLAEANTGVVRVRDLDRVTSIAAGGYATCAIEADLSVRCWGYLGERVRDFSFGNVACSDLPSPCLFGPTTIDGLLDTVAIAVGKEHACALDDGGAVRCWGGNRAGQLGTGDFTPHAAPVVVRDDVRLLAVGRLHTCVAPVSGGVLCTGDDEDGQLGRDAEFVCTDVSGYGYWCSPVWGSNRRDAAALDDHARGRGARGRRSGPQRDRSPVRSRSEPRHARPLECRVHGFLSGRMNGSKIAERPAT